MAQLFRSLSTARSTNEPPSVDTSVHKKHGYFINLDPATISVPFGANIDIRDTVDYKVSVAKILF